jgi:hypothetical protein
MKWNFMITGLQNLHHRYEIQYRLCRLICQPTLPGLSMLRNDTKNFTKIKSILVARVYLAVTYYRKLLLSRDWVDVFRLIEMSKINDCQDYEAVPTYHQETCCHDC